MKTAGKLASLLFSLAMLASIAPASDALAAQPASAAADDAAYVEAGGTSANANAAIGDAAYVEASGTSESAGAAIGNVSSADAGNAAFAAAYPDGVAAPDANGSFSALTPQALSGQGAILPMQGAILPMSTTYTVPVHGYNKQGYAYQVLALVNQQRAANGLSALAWDCDIENVVRLRAAETAVYWSHTRANGTSWTTIFPNIGNIWAGENIAAGQSSPSDVMNAWMNSTGHRANILNSNFNSMAVGCFQCNGMLYWVQEFSSDAGDGGFSNDNNKATWYIDTLPGNINVKASLSTLSLKSGDTYRFGVTDTNDSDAYSRNIKFYNVNAGNGWYANLLTSSHLAWSTSNSSVATVTTGSSDQEAYVNAKGSGTAVISCWIPGYTSSKATVTVTVANPAIASMSTPSAQTYTGYAITPSVVVKNADGATLASGTDYTLAYENNINAGTATVTATGKGTYAGSSKSATFAINKASLGLATAGTLESQSYSGSAITVDPVFAFNGKALAKGVDYVLEYYNNTNAGTATIVATGTGNFQGTKYAYFTITARLIASCIVDGLDSAMYTAAPITQAPQVRYDGTMLVEGTDYTVTYSNNINAGTANVHIAGKGNYTGYTNEVFAIYAAYLGNTTADPIADQYYTGSAITPELKLAYNGYTLMKGIDYTLGYSNNVAVGTATVHAQGMGNFQSSRYVDFKIVEREKESLVASDAAIDDATYTGSPVTPAMRLHNAAGEELVQGVDYTIAVSNNVNAGTGKVLVAGIGKYKGSFYLAFAIRPCDLSKTAFADADASHHEAYTGNAIEYRPTLALSGAKLLEGTDYTLAFRDNVNPGTATATATGKGNFTGTKDYTFVIDKPTDPGHTPAPNPGATWTRLGGANRVATMQLICQKGFSAGSCNTVILTTANNFADALAASGMAGAVGCPIITTDGARLSAEAAQEIVRLGARQVYILGGENALSADVEASVKSLGSGIGTVRLSGDDRIETDLDIYKTGIEWNGGWSDTCIIAKGWNYADALSVAPYAYAAKCPVFLTDTSGNLTQAERDAITGSGSYAGYDGFARVIVLGGTGGNGAISDSVIDSLGFDGGNVIRLAGENRLETSAKIAAWATGNDNAAAFGPSVQLAYEGMGVASANNFPDALASVDLLGPGKSVLLLVDDSPETKARLVGSQVQGAKQGYIFGGVAAVDAQIEGWLAN